LPKPGSGSSDSAGADKSNANSGNPFGAIFGGKSLPTATNPSSSSGSNTAKTGSSAAGMVCSEFRKPNSGVLYASLNNLDLSATQQSVAADLKLKFDDAKRLLQDEFENRDGAGWVHHYKANYSASFLNAKIRNTFSEYTLKPEMRLEMAARLRKAASDVSMSDEVKAEARFAYALILGRFQNIHKNPGLVDSYLNAAYKADNVGALYVKALRMYNGYGVNKNINAAANFSTLANNRLTEVNEEAERFSMRPLAWEAPVQLMTLNLTDKEFRGHQRYSSLAAKGSEMRQSLEKTMRSNKDPILRRQAEQLAASFDNATNELAEIFGLAGKVAASKLQIQIAKKELDQKQQVLKTEIAINKETAKFVEDGINNADQALKPEAERKAKEIRSRFDGLAERSFRLSFRILARFSLSEDLLFAAKQVGRMRDDGCRFVYAMDDFFKRSNVAFTEEEKKKLGNEAAKGLASKIVDEKGDDEEKDN
jgi:hypothetical protein